MFESWTDVAAAAMLGLAVVYVGWEVAQRQRKLRELFEVLDGEDSKITAQLERMVSAGKLQPMPYAGAA